MTLLLALFVGACIGWLVRGRIDRPKRLTFDEHIEAALRQVNEPPSNVHRLDHFRTDWPA